MGASASLSSGMLSVEPGGEAMCEVTVRNSGTVVDEFAVAVVGEGAEWASADPPVLNLFPGAEGMAIVRFRPPRSSAIKSGVLPFGVRVASREDPTGSVVEEGTIDVGRFSDTFIELVPRTSRGRRSATHELALDNRGNARVNATITAKDPDAHLKFEFEPASIVAEPDTATFARIKVIPRTAFLRGPAKTFPFQVTVQSDGPMPLMADGTILQEALIPKWVPKALIGLAALAVVWAVLLRPTVKSAARDAVAPKLQAQDNAIQQIAAKAGVPAPDTGGSGGGGGGNGSLSGGDPFDERLAVDVDPGQQGGQKYEVPKDKVISLTDVVLQNPEGDTGTLEVRKGSKALIRVNLANFRDLDYHFVSPVVFKGGDEVVVYVTQCTNPAGKKCTPAAFVTGTEAKKA